MAQILTCYYRPDRGGLFKRLLRAMLALANAGHTVHYLSTRPFDIRHPRIVFHRFPWPKNQCHTLFFWASFHLLAPLLLVVLSWRRNITHAFGFSPTYTFLLKPACKLRRAPLTCFVHGDAILSHRLKRRPAWLIRLDTWIEGRAIQGVKPVVLQRHLIQMLLNRHPGIAMQPFDLLPNDLPKTVEWKKDRVEDHLRLAMVGALEPVKNHRLAIEMIARSGSRIYSLHLFGVGSLENELRETILAKGLTDFIFLHGWVPSDNIWPQVDILLLPSLHEGMPEVLLEAIANRVPVLASDISAHRELLPADFLLPLDNPLRWIGELEGIRFDLESVRERQTAYAEKFRLDWDRRIVDVIVTEA